MEMSTYLHDVRVYDVKGMHVIGHLLAIDDNGMSIASDLPMEPGHTLNLMLEDITQLEPGKKVKISGVCEGCELDESTLDLYCVRFSMSPLSSKAKDLIQALGYSQTA